MHSVRAKRDRHDRDAADGGGLARIHRRGRLAAAIGGAGYIATFITDVARHDHGDDSIMAGLERGFLAVGLAGFFVSFVLWVLTASPGYAQWMWQQRRRAHDYIDERIEASMSSSGEHRIS